MNKNDTVAWNDTTHVISHGSFDNLLSFYGQLKTTRISHRSLRRRLLGRVLERLSVAAFRADPTLGREFHTKAKTHYYWSANNIPNRSLPFQRANAGFDYGRTQVLRGILEILPYESFPGAYSYLDTNPRNHEDITKYVLEVGHTVRPTRSPGPVADGIEGIKTLQRVAETYARVLENDPSPLVEQVVSGRMQRMDRLESAFDILISHKR